MILAIDPGEIHCGVAWLKGPTIVRTVEWTPDRLFVYLETLESKPHEIELIVCESYHLYPWLLEEQGFSEVLTAQTIGVIRWLARKARITVKFQPASIKKPARAQMRVRGIEVPGKTTHEKDAGLHGLHHHFNPKGSPSERKAISRRGRTVRQRGQRPRSRTPGQGGGR